MSASTDDMINQLQSQLAQPPQPSLFGISAPQDPQGLQALLAKLKQQQYLSQVGNTGGPYGYLHDAGQKAFADVGQQLGNAASGALQQVGAKQAAQAAQGPQSGGQASPAPQGGGDTSFQSAPVRLTNPQAVSAAILKGKAAYQAQISAGVQPDVAKVNTLKLLITLGVPGADAELDKANDQTLKNAATVAETAKNNSQSKMDDSDITKNDVENNSKQWKTSYADPNGLFLLQTSGTGETRRVELKPPPSAAAQAAANLDPSSIQFAADTYRTTGKFPGSFARNPAMQAAVLKQVAADAAANGDTAGSIQARVASLKAGSTALDQVTKQESFTTSAVNTLDKNLQALQTIGSKLDSTGSPIINKVLNHYNQGVVSDPTTAAYVAMLNAVQGEYAKIASNNNGNSPVSDSAKADAKDVINKAMSQGGIAGVRQAMLQESANRLQAIREAKQGLIGQLSGNAPGAPQGNGQPPISSGTQQPPTPSANASPPPGWILKADAKGNKAYVSPDGKQYMEVK